MINKTYLVKKVSGVLCVSILAFTVSACSPSESTNTVTDQTASEPQTTETSIPENITVYENKDFGLSIPIPSDWSEPMEKVNEYGLTILSATEEFDNSVMILVRDIPSETPSLKEYAESNTITLEESYNMDTIKMNEIIEINDTEFLKVIMDDSTPGEELYQIMYTSFANDSGYEIVFTLAPDYYEANKDIFDAIEGNIRVTN